MLVSRLPDAYSVDATTEGIGLCPLPPVTHIALLSRASHAFVLEKIYLTPILKNNAPNYFTIVFLVVPSLILMMLIPVVGWLNWRP